MAREPVAVATFSYAVSGGSYLLSVSTTRTSASPSAPRASEPIRTPTFNPRLNWNARGNNPYFYYFVRVKRLYAPVNGAGK